MALHCTCFTCGFTLHLFHLWLLQRTCSTRDFTLHVFHLWLYIALVATEFHRLFLNLISEMACLSDKSVCLIPYHKTSKPNRCMLRHTSIISTASRIHTFTSDSVSEVNMYARAPWNPSLRTTQKLAMVLHVRSHTKQGLYTLHSTEPIYNFYLISS